MYGNKKNKLIKIDEESSKLPMIQYGNNEETGINNNIKPLVGIGKGLYKTTKENKNFTEKKGIGRTINYPNAGDPVQDNGPFANYTFDPNIDYMAKMVEAEKAGDYNAARYYENMRNAKIAGGFGGIFQPTYRHNYHSQYDDKINGLRQQLEDYPSFRYDVNEDENYKNLSNVYHKNAQEAQKNALAQAAAANGGRLGSNAIIAASLGYADQMNELEAEIPQLRELARQIHLAEKADVRNTLNDYIAAEEQDYSKWNNDYNKMYGISRDNIADDKSEREFAMAEKQADANLKSIMKNDAIQASLLTGTITKEAAELLGVPEGSKTIEALDRYRQTQINLAQILGYVPDSLAIEYGLEKGGPTLDKLALNETINQNNYERSQNQVIYGDNSILTEDDQIFNGGNDLTSSVNEFMEQNSNLDGPELLAKAENYAKKNNIDVEEFKDEIARSLGIVY